MSTTSKAKRGNVSKGNGCCESTGYKPYEVCRDRVALSPAQNYVRSVMQAPCARIYAYHEVGSGKTKLGLMTAHRLAYEKEKPVVDGVIYAAPLQKDVASVISELWDNKKTVDDTKKPILNKFAFHREMLGKYNTEHIVIDGGKMPEAKRVTVANEKRPRFYINTHEIVSHMLMQSHKIDFRRRKDFDLKSNVNPQEEQLSWIQHVQKLLHNKLVIVDEGHKGVEDGYGDVGAGNKPPSSTLILFALMFAPPSTRILIMSATPYAPSKANPRGLGGLGVQLLPLMLPSDSVCTGLKRNQLPSMNQIRDKAKSWTPSRLERENLMLNADNTFNYGDPDNGDPGNVSPQNKSISVTASLMKRAMGGDESVASQVISLLRKVDAEPSGLIERYQSMSNKIQSPSHESISVLMDQLSRYFQALYIADRGVENGVLREHARRLVSFFKTSGDATLFPRVRYKPCASDSTGAGCVLRIACPIAPIHQFLIRKPSTQHAHLQLMQRRLLISMQQNKGEIEHNKNNKPTPAEFGAAILSAYSGNPGLLESILNVVLYETPEDNKKQRSVEEETMAKASMIQKFLQLITRLPRFRNGEVLNNVLARNYNTDNKDQIASAQHLNMLTECMGGKNAKSFESRDEVGTKGCTRISTYFLPFILRWVNSPASELINLPNSLRTKPITDLVEELIKDNKEARELASTISSSDEQLKKIPNILKRIQTLNQEAKLSEQDAKLIESIGKFYDKTTKVKLSTVARRLQEMQNNASAALKAAVPDKERIDKKRIPLARTVHAWLSKFLDRIGSDASKGTGINPQQMLKLRHGSVMKGERELRKIETLAKKPDGVSQDQFGQYFAMGGKPDKLTFGKTQQHEVPAYALYSMKIFMAAHIIHGSTLPIKRTQNNDEAWSHPTIPTSGQSDRTGNIMLYFDPSHRKQFYGDQAYYGKTPCEGTKGGILRTLIDQECCVAILTPEPQDKDSIQQCFAVFATNKYSTSYDYWTRGKNGRNLQIGLIEAVKYKKLTGNGFDHLHATVMARKKSMSRSRNMEESASLTVYREYIDEYLKSIGQAIRDREEGSVVVLGQDNSKTRKESRQVYTGFKTGTDLMTGDGAKKSMSNPKQILDRVHEIGFVHDIRFTRLYTILTHLVDETAYKDLLKLRRLQASEENKPHTDEQKQARARYVKELFATFERFQESCNVYVKKIIRMIRKERASLLSYSSKQESQPFMCMFDQSQAKACAKIVNVYNLPENVTGDLLNVVCSNATHGTSFYETLTAILLHQTQGKMPITPSQLQQIVGRITRRCSTKLHYIPRRGMPEVRIYSLVSTSLNDIWTADPQKRRTTRVSENSGTNNDETYNSNSDGKELGFDLQGGFDRQEMRNPETLIPNTLKMLARYPFPWYNPRGKDKIRELQNSLQQFYRYLVTGAQDMCLQGKGRALQITSIDECKSKNGPTTRPFYVLPSQTLDQTASTKTGVERFMRNVEKYARNRSLFQNYVANISAMNIENISSSEEFNALVTLLRAGIVDGVVRRAPKVGTALSKFRPPPGATDKNSSNGLEEKLAQLALKVSPKVANAISAVIKGLINPHNDLIRFRVRKLNRKSAPSLTLERIDTSAEIKKVIEAVRTGQKRVSEDVEKALKNKSKAYHLMDKKKPFKEMTNEEKETIREADSDISIIKTYVDAFKDLVPSSTEDIALFFESGGGAHSDKPPPGWKQIRVGTRTGHSFLAFARGLQTPVVKDKKIRTLSGLATYLGQEGVNPTNAEVEWLKTFKRIKQLKSKGIVLHSKPYNSKKANIVAARVQNTRSLTEIMNEKRKQFDTSIKSKPELKTPDSLLWRAFDVNGKLRYLPKKNTSRSIGENYLTPEEVLAIITKKGRSASNKEKVWKENMEMKMLAAANKYKFAPATTSFLKNKMYVKLPRRSRHPYINLKNVNRANRNLEDSKTNSSTKASRDLYATSASQSISNEQIANETSKSPTSLPDPSLSITNLLEKRIPETPGTWELFMNGAKKRYRRKNNGKIAIQPGKPGQFITNPKTLAVMLKKEGTNAEKKWAGRYLHMEELKRSEGEFSKFVKKLGANQVRQRPESFKISMQEPEYLVEKRKKGRKAPEPKGSASLTPQERFKFEWLKQRLDAQKHKTPWVGFGKDDSLNDFVERDVTSKEIRAFEEYEKKQRKKVVADVQARQMQDQRSLTDILKQAFVPYRQMKEPVFIQRSIVDPVSVPNRSKQSFGRTKNNVVKSLTNKNKESIENPWKILVSKSPSTAWPRKVIQYPNLNARREHLHMLKQPLAEQSANGLMSYKKRVTKMAKELDDLVKKRNAKRAEKWIRDYKKSNAPIVKFMANALTNKNMDTWRKLYLEYPLPDAANKVTKAEALVRSMKRKDIEERLKKNAKDENARMKAKPAAATKNISIAPKRATPKLQGVDNMTKMEMQVLGLHPHLDPSGKNPLLTSTKRRGVLLKAYKMRNELEKNERGREIMKRVMEDLKKATKSVTIFKNKTPKDIYNRKLWVKAGMGEFIRNES